MKLFKFVEPTQETLKEWDVTDSDVLSGRGNGVANRPGNIYYSKLIRENQYDYQNGANSRRKKEIAQSIIDIIKTQNPPGRFLKSKEPFVWCVQNDSFAMKKIAQALREKPKKGKILKPPSAGLTPPSTDLRKRSMDHQSNKCLITTSDDSVPDNSVSATVLKTNADAQEINPSYRPMKRSIIGDSKRKFFRWMNSLSRLNLLNISVRSIDDDTYAPEMISSPNEVKAAQELLSSDEIIDPAPPGVTTQLSNDDVDGAFDELSPLDEIIDISLSKSVDADDDELGLRAEMLKLSSDENDINKSMANLNFSTTHLTEENDPATPTDNVVAV